MWLAAVYQPVYPFTTNVTSIVGKIHKQYYLCNSVIDLNSTSPIPNVVNIFYT